MDTNTDHFTPLVLHELIKLISELSDLSPPWSIYIVGLSKHSQSMHLYYYIYTVCMFVYVHVCREETVDKLKYEIKHLNDRNNWFRCQYEESEVALRDSRRKNKVLRTKLDE